MEYPVGFDVSVEKKNTLSNFGRKGISYTPVDARCVNGVLECSWEQLRHSSNMYGIPNCLTTTLYEERRSLYEGVRYTWARE